MALFISEQVAAVTAYNAGNPQFTVYYGENAAEAARQAQLAQGYAVDAATSAAYAGGFQTPEYATRAAGEAATTVGQVFRVPLNTSPQTFAWYRRAAIDSDGSSLDLNFTTASFESYALSEEVSPIGAVDSGYLVKGNGLTTPVSASIIYDSGTNIGIGTSSPQAKVHTRVTTDVNMWISNNGAELRTIAINDGMSAYINWRRDANQHSFETSGAERLRIKSGGQVRFVPRASAPSGAEAGDVYYDSSTNKLRCYNGSTWNDLF